MKNLLLEKHQLYGYHALLTVNLLDDLIYNRIPFSKADKIESNRDKEYQTNKFYKYFLSLQNGKFNSPYVQNYNFDAILNINLRKVKDYNSRNFDVGPVQYPGEKYEAEERIFVKSENISELKPMNKYVESIHVLITSNINDMYLTDIQLYKGIIKKSNKLNIPLFLYDNIGYFKSQYNGYSGDVIKKYYKKLIDKENEIIKSYNNIKEIIKIKPSLKEEYIKKNLYRKEYPYLSTLIYMLSLITENYIPTKFNIYESNKINNIIRNIIGSIYKNINWIDDYNDKIKKEMKYNNFPYGFEMRDLHFILEKRYATEYNMLLELDFLIKEVLKNKRLIS